jgi:thioredoxin-like negative regulator of GroEL
VVARRTPSSDRPGSSTDPSTASRFDARSIPTLLILKEGREVDRLVGVQPRAEIVRRLERVIA